MELHRGFLGNVLKGVRAAGRNAGGRSERMTKDKEILKKRERKYRRSPSACLDKEMAIFLLLSKKYSRSFTC